MRRCLLSLGALALAACGGPLYLWDKPGVTDEQRGRNQAACVRKAASGYYAPGPLWNQDVYEACMRQPGYRLTRRAG